MLDGPHAPRQELKNIAVYAPLSSSREASLKSVSNSLTTPSALLRTMLTSAFVFLLGLVAVRGFKLPRSKSGLPPLNLIQVRRDELPGVFTEQGGYFDPLGMSNGVDDETLKVWRESELKHGRICMLASVGLIVQENFHPLFGNAGKLLGSPVYHFQELRGVLGPVFATSFLIGCGIIEGKAISKYIGSSPITSGLKLKDDVLCGDLDFDPFGLSPDKDLPAGKKSTYNKVSGPAMQRRLSQELNNGRTAMIGVVGMIGQMLVDHRGVVEHVRVFGLGPGVGYGDQ